MCRVIQSLVNWGYVDVFNGVLMIVRTDCRSWTGVLVVGSASSPSDTVGPEQVCLAGHRCI